MTSAVVRTFNFAREILRQKNHIHSMIEIIHLNMILWNKTNIYVQRDSSDKHIQHIYTEFFTARVKKSFPLKSESTKIRKPTH